MWFVKVMIEGINKGDHGTKGWLKRSHHHHQIKMKKKGKTIPITYNEMNIKVQFFFLSLIKSLISTWSH